MRISDERSVALLAGFPAPTKKSIEELYARIKKIMKNRNIDYNMFVSFGLFDSVILFDLQNIEDIENIKMDLLSVEYDGKKIINISPIIMHKICLEKMSCKPERALPGENALVLSFIHFSGDVENLCKGVSAFELYATYIHNTYVVLKEFEYVDEIFDYTVRFHDLGIKHSSTYVLVAWPLKYARFGGEKILLESFLRRETDFLSTADPLYERMMAFWDFSLEFEAENLSNAIEMILDNNRENSRCVTTIKRRRR